MKRSNSETTPHGNHSYGYTKCVSDYRETFRNIYVQNLKELLLEAKGSLITTVAMGIKK